MEEINNAAKQVILTLVNDADEHGYTDAEFGLILRKMATLIAAGRI